MVSAVLPRLGKAPRQTQSHLLPGPGPQGGQSSASPPRPEDPEPAALRPRFMVQNKLGEPKRIPEEVPGDQLCPFNSPRKAR